MQNHSDENDELQEGQRVTGTIFKFSPLGANIEFSGGEGLLYNDELTDDMQVGDEVTVYIRRIREDGKIDFSLEKGGYKNFIDHTTNTIIEALQSEGGFLPFNDKSSPEAIQERFQMSKKKFKEAIGNLYKNRQIEIIDDGIKLI